MSASTTLCLFGLDTMILLGMVRPEQKVEAAKKRIRDEARELFHLNARARRTI